MADFQKILTQLQAACDHPRVQLERYLAQGKQVVGCFAPTPRRSWSTPAA